jgi:hypothetical protein
MSARNALPDTTNLTLSLIPAGALAMTVRSAPYAQLVGLVGTKSVRSTVAKAATRVLLDGISLHLLIKLRLAAT